MPKKKLPKPPMPLWKPVEADPRVIYTEEQIERSTAYNRPLQRAGLVTLAINLIEIGLVIRLHLAPTILRGMSIAWPIRLMIVLGVLMALDMLTGLPVSIWQYGHDKRWGFNTSTPGRFVADLAKNAALATVILSMIFIPIYALIRATKLWWVWGSLVFGVLGLVLALLGPTLQKLFNKFTPLEDETLRARLLARAHEAGAKVGEILVMDASKRTRKDNAFFGGVGKTKRIVVFDNLLELGHDPVDVVVSHEIGHWLRTNVLRATIGGLLIMPFFLGGVALIVTWDAALRSAGVRSLGDPASLPLLMTGFALVFFVSRYYGAWRSRWKERVADFDSLELTENLDAYRALWRAMPERNLPDLVPSWWRRIKLTHPPPHERLVFADVWERTRQLPPGARNGENQGSTS